MNRISHNELAVEVPKIQLDRKDEIGGMAKSLEKMRKNLISNIKKVQSLSETLTVEKVQTLFISFRFVRHYGRDSRICKRIFCQR